MKTYEDIQRRIEILNALIEEIYMLLATENPTARQEADAEVVIARFRNQIEALSWSLN